MNKDTRQLTEASLGRVLQHMEKGRSWGIISAWRHEQAPEERNRQTDRLKGDIKRMKYGYFPMKGKWRETVTDATDAARKDIEDTLQRVIGNSIQEIEWTSDNSVEIDLDDETPFSIVRKLNQNVDGTVSLNDEGRHLSIVFADPVGEKVDVWEQSFFIVGISRAEIARLGMRYNQEAVVYGEPSPTMNSDVDPSELHNPGKGAQILLIEPPNRVLTVLGENNRRGFHPNKVADVYSEIKGKTFTLGESRHYMIECLNVESVAIPLNKNAEDMRVPKGTETNEQEDVHVLIQDFITKQAKTVKIGR